MCLKLLKELQIVYVHTRNVIIFYEEKMILINPLGEFETYRVFRKRGVGEANILYPIIYVFTYPKKLF